MTRKKYLGGRRGFLQLGLQLGALGALGAGGTLLGGLLSNPQRVRAQEGAPKLVVALAYGGWDSMWVMDPKPDSPEVDRIPGDVRRFRELNIWDHDSRPQVRTFFEKWASITSVINGISVESLAHETCIDVMLSGRPGGRTPDLAARVAQELGGDRAIPYLTMSPQAEVAGLEAHAGTFGATNQLMALVNPDFAWPRGGAAAADAGLQLTDAERSLITEWQAGSVAEMRRGTSPRSAQLLSDYEASLPRMARLQQQAQTGGMFSDAALFEDVENPFRHVARAISEGVAQTAIVQPNYYWDTHSYNSVQRDAYEGMFFGLNQLLSDLERQGALNDTLVLVLSEMGRTPRHNAQGGKDHWPWTSALFIGPDIEGGRTIGQTDEWLRPSPIDLQTGLVSDAPEAVMLHSEHVLGAAAKALDVDAADWFQRPPLLALGGSS